MSETLACRIQPVAPERWTLAAQAAWLGALAAWLPEAGWTLAVEPDGALACRFERRQLELADGAWETSDRAEARARLEGLREALESLSRGTGWPEAPAGAKEPTAPEAASGLKPAARATETEAARAVAAARTLGRHLPRASAWTLRCAGLAPLTLKAAHLRAAPAVSARAKGRTVTARATVRLAGIDFERGWVRFLSDEAAPEAELQAPYPPEWERRLLKRRAEPLRLTGALRFDGAGRLLAIESLEALEPIDLTPLSLAELSLQGASCRLLRPLVLEVGYRAAEGGRYTASLPRLGLTVEAEERSDLLAALSEALEAALEAPETAQRLSRQLAGLVVQPALEDWAS